MEAEGLLQQQDQSTRKRQRSSHGGGEGRRMHVRDGMADPRLTKRHTRSDEGPDCVSGPSSSKSPSYTARPLAAGS